VKPLREPPATAESRGLRPGTVQNGGGGFWHSSPGRQLMAPSPSCAALVVAVVVPHRLFSWVLRCPVDRAGLKRLQCRRGAGLQASLEPQMAATLFSIPRWESGGRQRTVPGWSSTILINSGETLSLGSPNVNDTNSPSKNLGKRAWGGEKLGTDCDCPPEGSGARAELVEADRA